MPGQREAARAEPRCASAAQATSASVRPVGRCMVLRVLCCWYDTVRCDSATKLGIVGSVLRIVVVTQSRGMQRVLGWLHTYV